MTRRVVARARLSPRRREAFEARVAARARGRCFVLLAFCLVSVVLFLRLLAMQSFTRSAGEIGILIAPSGRD
ncbi:MAG TPA: hypothetical protein VMK42_07310 [Anaeromyxobacteraceae bacterium]|nr:hypothetical protein [Anaeromyxobacteraceae bacterium]